MSIYANFFNMKTIKSVLQSMKEAVEKSETVPPTQWVNWGLDLATLWQDLKVELTKYEMLYKSEVVDLIEQGKKISEAERTVEARSENYKTYSYLKGRDKIVEEFIRLAKVRSKIEQDY